MTKNIRNRYFQHLTPQIYSTNKKDIVFNKYIEEGKIVLITITHHLTTQEEAIRVEKEQILKTPGLLNDYNYIQKPIKHITMPRSKVEPHTFIAGQLPVITFENKQYYVDGRMKEIRSVDNFMDKIYPKQVTNKDDIKIINFEFYGNY